MEQPIIPDYLLQMAQIEIPEADPRDLAAVMWFLIRERPPENWPVLMHGCRFILGFGQIRSFPTAN